MMLETAGTPAKVCHPYDDIAQLVEQGAVNAWVVGSSPSVVATLQQPEKTNDLYFCSVMYLHQPYRLVFLFRLKTT